MRDDTVVESRQRALRKESARKSCKSINFLLEAWHPCYFRMRKLSKEACNVTMFVLMCVCVKVWPHIHVINTSYWPSHWYISEGVTVNPDQFWTVQNAAGE